MYEYWLEPPVENMPLCPNCGGYDVTYEDHGKCDECGTLWSFLPQEIPDPELIMDVELSDDFWK